MTGDARLRAQLRGLGVTPYVRRTALQDAEAAPKVTPEAAPEAAPKAAPEAPDETSGDEAAWKALVAEVKDCTRCALHEHRTNTVFGVGDRGAQWLFVGEGPGADEDAKGEPFVGRAGQLLNRMLKAIGFEREQVYIANVVKCRPPDNRNPRPEEAAECMGYLHRQIALLRPQIIVCLGGVAMTEILKTDASVGSMRGRAHQYEGQSGSAVPVIVTYHPAYLLRSPTQKKAAWEDLQLACRTAGHEFPTSA